MSLKLCKHTLTRQWRCAETISVDGQPHQQSNMPSYRMCLHWPMYRPLILAPCMPYPQNSAPICIPTIIFNVNSPCFISTIWVYCQIIRYGWENWKKPCLIFQNNKFRCVYKGLNLTTWRCTFCKARIHTLPTGGGCHIPSVHMGCCTHARKCTLPTYNKCLWSIS